MARTLKMRNGKVLATLVDGRPRPYFCEPGCPCADADCPACGGTAPQQIDVTLPAMTDAFAQCAGCVDIGGVYRLDFLDSGTDGGGDYCRWQLEFAAGEPCGMSSILLKVWSSGAVTVLVSGTSPAGTIHFFSQSITLPALCEFAGETVMSGFSGYCFATGSASLQAV